MRRLAFPASATVAVTLLVACGSTSPAPTIDDTPDAGKGGDAAKEASVPQPVDDGGGDAMDAAPALMLKPGDCMSLKEMGQPVGEEAMAAAPPPATGGPINDGIYVLTKFILYTGKNGMTGPTGRMVSETYEFAGTRFQFVTDIVGDSTEGRGSGTFTFATQNLSIDYDCPMAGGGTAQYSSDGKTFIDVYSTDSSNNVAVTTLTKQ